MQAKVREGGARELPEGRGWRAREGRGWSVHSQSWDGIPVWTLEGFWALEEAQEWWVAC